MKQVVSADGNKASDESKPSHIDGAIGHPVQRKITESPRQRKQQRQLMHLQGASAPSDSEGLPPHLRAGIETLSGMDMGDVAVHRNSSTPAQLNALAYAQGNDILLGPGQDQHLPHEAWHVVQQRQGRVKITLQSGGVGINDEPQLEQEADVMGEQALQMKPSLGLQETSKSILSGTALKPHAMSPIQAMTFSRFNWKQNPLNWGWKYNAKEKNLRALETSVKNALAPLKGYTKGLFGGDILKLEGEFHVISKDEYVESQYDAVLKSLTDLLASINDLTGKVSLADDGDNDLNASLTTGRGQGPLAKEVVVELLKVYAALPPAMNTAKNKGLIKEAMYPTVRLSGGFYNVDMAASTTQFARTRGPLLIKNFNQLNSRILDSWGFIQDKFSIDGDLEEIELTGSDFHNSGQQVAIVKSTTGKKVAYKPRTVSPDAGLMGRDGSAFNDLNKLSGGTVKLPTMKFGEKKDKEGSFSFVEFQDKATKQTNAEVREQYERYGELVIASKLFGVNDLHNENVIAKSATPTVIDAETAFLPFVMDAVSFAKTEMGMTLGKVKKHLSSDPAENFFYTQEEEDAYKLSGRSDFTAYIVELREQDLNGQKKYMPYFETGMDNVINLLKSKKDDVKRIIFDRMKNSSHVRVVPFNTQDFHDSIQLYRSLLVQGRQVDADDAVGRDVTKMKEAVKFKGFSIVSDEWAPTVTSLVGKALKADYQAEDTPILHFEPARNELHFHGKNVGFSEKWEDPEEVIIKIVNSIVYADKDKIKADLKIGQ